MTKALTGQRSRRGNTPDARERELKRLRLSVCDDIGFRLYLATYDQPKRRDELIARVIKEVEAQEVRVTRLDLAEAGPETNLVRLLRAHVAKTELPPGWRQAVMITGIEQRVDYSAGPKGFAFLHQANLLRDALPEAVPVPVVLWLSRMASAALPAEAPDLWHWRAANFDFTGDEAPRLELLRELTILQPEDGGGLSDEQRQARARMLEDLLAELENKGPPKSKRQIVERASVLLGLGREELGLGQAAKAVPRLENALAVIRRIGDPPLEAKALNLLGALSLSLGEAQKSVTYREQALAVAREIGDLRSESAAFAGLGNVHMSLDEPGKAIEHYKQSIAIARQIGDRHGESTALGKLGDAWARLREPRRAIDEYEQQLAIVRELGDRKDEGAVLGSLGKAWADLGERRRAIEIFEQLFAIARELGDRQNEIIALLSLGLAWTGLVELQQAIVFYERALAIAGEIGHRGGEATALYSLAMLRDLLGERTEAVRLAREALAIYQAIGHNHMVERVRARLEEWQGENFDGEPE